MTKKIADLLPDLMRKVERLQQNPPQQILLAFPDIAGEKWRVMARAVKVDKEILTIHVKNSMALSQIVHEKSRLLRSFKEKFPSCPIQDIRFCIG
jgi:hypothetical protein